MKEKAYRGNRLDTLVKPEHHTFREKRLCSSPTYRQALAEALTTMAECPPMPAHILADHSTHRHPLGCHGFFYEAPERGSNLRHQTAAPSSGHNEFRHASKRYRDGWDAGKEPS